MMSRLDFLPRTMSLVILFALSLLVSPQAVMAQVSVLTQHNDNLRTGGNLNEATLNTTNVNVTDFGKLFTLPVDGFTYAQPLYAPGVAIGVATHNVVYVATAHDSVYAFDADTGSLYWQTSLGTPVPSGVINTPNILVEVGIISTPVIDLQTNTIYVVALTYENNNQIFRLHALDLSTGAEQSNSPKLITASVPGSGDGNDGAGNVPFLPEKENQRAAVTLVNGVLYLAFASHEDYDPYHGWVLAYSESTLQQLAAYNVTPNGGRGGIWMGGQGLVADAAGNLYLLSGNSTQSEEDSVGDFGESFVKLTLNGSSLAETDYFKPKDYDFLNAFDVDLGSGGPVGIPGTSYIVGGGKQGILYLVDTANMGQLNQSADGMRQEWQADKGVWGSPVFWNSSTPTLYVWAQSDTLNAFSFNAATGLFGTTQSSKSSFASSGGNGCLALSVSSAGSATNSGILWAATPDGDPDHDTVPGTLYAFSATDVTNAIWTSKQNTARDDFGNFAKFDSPTVANGKVYLGTDSGQVVVYGELSATTGGDFTLAANPTSVNVPQAGQGSTTLTASDHNGFAGVISYSASNLPAGVTATFTPGLAGTTTLSLTATNTAAVGSAQVTITATSGNLTHTTNINVTVYANFALSTDTPTLSLCQSATAISNITVQPTGNFSGGVTFSATGLPTGVTATFSPTTSTTASVMTLTASSTAATGPATITVTGINGALSQTTTIALTVTGNFSLSDNPTTLTVSQGTTGSSTVTVLPTIGFTNAVTFSASGLPSGVTAQFSPGTSTTAATMVLTATRTATTGESTVTITGIGGGLTRTTTLDLTINGNFTIAASPTSLTMLQGTSSPTTVTVTPSGGFTGTVTYSVSGLPSGVTASFSPTSSTDTTVMTLTTSDTAATGIAPITITGTSGLLTNTAPLTLTVNVGWTLTGFTVTPGVVDGGNAVSSTVTLSRIAPVEGQVVSLSVPAASAPFLSFPATVTVPSGQTSVTFSNIQTHTVTGPQAVTMTAGLGASSMSAGLSINFINGGTQAGGLQFFSEPWAYHDLIGNIFEFALSPNQLVNWNSSTLTYIYQGGATAATTPITLTPGLGYWAVFPAAGSRLLYLGTPVSSTVPTIETLNVGWNAIGDPYTTPVNISSLTFGSTHQSFVASSAVVSPTLYYFQQGLSATSGTYVAATSTDSLTPGKGYWIYAYSATTLTFPLPAGGIVTPPPPASGVSAPPVTTTGTGTTFKKRKHH